MKVILAFALFVAVASAASVPGPVSISYRRTCTLVLNQLSTQGQIKMSYSIHMLSIQIDIQGLKLVFHITSITSNCPSLQAISFRL